MPYKNSRLVLVRTLCPYQSNNSVPVIIISFFSKYI